MATADEVEKIKGVEYPSFAESGFATRECSVSRNHSIFTNGELSSFSRAIGIPLLFYNTGPSVPVFEHIEDWYAVAPRSQYPDKQFGKLMIRCESAQVGYFGGESERLREIPLRWRHQASGVLVVRKDGEDLYQHHLETLLRFIREVTKLNVRGANYYHGDLVGAERIHEIFTPGDFKEYYKEIEDGWKLSRKDYAHLLRLPSPFICKVSNSNRTSA